MLTGKFKGKLPRYRCHLGCILLKMAAISLSTGRPDFYPSIPDSFTYLDPPFRLPAAGTAEYEATVRVGERAGRPRGAGLTVPVRSGPGWVVISASDLARFGLLNALGGQWRGQQLLDPAFLRGHSGGNHSGVSGESTHFTAMGVVTTNGIHHGHATSDRSFVPEHLFVGPVELGRPAPVAVFFDRQGLDALATASATQVGIGFHALHLPSGAEYSYSPDRRFPPASVMNRFSP